MTSKPAMRERILPLHSVWLDLLILRMMEPCANPTKPVWFVLDELASLNKLPQLHTAVTENRKYGNPVVLGFQGRSQLEKRYGQDAEAMLSQPATKIFFKTSEPRAAKWISETLGEIEVERLKESRTPGLLRSKKNFAMEIATKPLVMASEIAGLEPLRGYIKQENRVLPVKFALTRLKKLQPEFIARKMTIPEPRAVPPPLPAPPLPKVASPLPKPAQTKKPVQLQVVFPEPPPDDAPVPPKKPIEPEKPKSPFGQKQGTTDGKPRDWDESEWID
jgi:type IV secretory pathway TraG/TraD family ATPase VirD4